VKKLILMATLTTVMVTATTPVALAQMEEPLSYVGYITNISGNGVLVEEDPQDPVLGGAGTNKGYFIPPTIYAGVDPKARIAQEEIFGPLLFSCPLSLFTVFPRRPLLGFSVNRGKHLPQL